MRKHARSFYTYKGKEMKLLIGLTVSVLLVSCGSNNEITEAPIPAPNSGQVNHLMELDENVDVGNFVTFEKPKFLNLSRGLNCGYIITSRVEISNLNKLDDSIELTIKKSERENRRNSGTCPANYGAQAFQTKTYKLSSLVAAYKMRRDEALNADLLCKNTNWCKRAKLIKKRNTKYKGIPATYTEMRLFSKSGKSYKRSSWVAKNNLFLNTFAFQIKKWNSSTLIDFKRTTTFSIKNLD